MARENYQKKRNRILREVRISEIGQHLERLNDPGKVDLSRVKELEKKLSDEPQKTEK